LTAARACLGAAQIPEAQMLVPAQTALCGLIAYRGRVDQRLLASPLAKEAKLPQPCLASHKANDSALILRVTGQNPPIGLKLFVLTHVRTLYPRKIQSALNRRVR